MANANPPTETKVITVTVLHPDVYRKLEQELSKTVVTDATSPGALGFALGVESVLKRIRNGFVLQT